MKTMLEEILVVLIGRLSLMITGDGEYECPRGIQVHRVDTLRENGTRRQHWVVEGIEGEIFRRLTYAGEAIRTMHRRMNRARLIATKQIEEMTACIEFAQKKIAQAKTSTEYNPLVGAFDALEIVEQAVDKLQDDRARVMQVANTLPHGTQARKSMFAIAARVKTAHQQGTEQAEALTTDYNSQVSKYDKAA